MKKWLFIIWVFFFASCISSKTKNTDKYNYLGFGMLLEAYYRDYYEYPQNIDDFILYCSSIQEQAFGKTIKKIEENRTSLNWILSDDKITIKLEDSIIYETHLRCPCEELSYNLGVYLGKILFFNIDGIPVYSEELEEEFKSETRAIKMHYSKIVAEENTTKYHILEFSIEKGLVPFCIDDNIPNELEYYVEIEKYLKEFTHKYKINKVVFITRTFKN